MNGKRAMNDHLRKGTKMRTRYIWVAFILLIGVYVTSSQAQEHTMPTVGNYRELVGELVDLKKAVFEEQQRWEEQKAYLENEKKLLLKEEKILKERIREAKENKSEHEIEVAEIRQSMEEAEVAIKNLTPAVERAEIVLQKWKNSLPESLKSDFPGNFEKIDKEDNVSRRLQKVYGSYAYLEQMSHSIKVTQEILKLDQNEGMVFDVIYFGLAQAYAVSKNSKMAAIGSFHSDSWNWKKENTIAPQVREVVSLINGDVAPKMVSLPISVDAGDLKEGR
jgi:tetratricopeptide (TPR) repeat protein